MNKDLSSDIITSLKYRNIFKYPLSFFQLGTYLISSKKYTYEDFCYTLKSLLRSKKVLQLDSKYFLPEISPINWETRRKNSLKLINSYLPIFEIIKKIPWIEFIGISGSCAAFNADSKSDLDIVIISKSRRLWVSRFFVVLILKILEAYPIREKNYGKLCPNLYFDKSHLKWPKEKRNIYVANEICLLWPVFDRNLTYFEFLSANSWVLDFINFHTIPNLKNYKFKKESKGLCLFDFVEEGFYFLQKFYMRSKITTEQVEKGFIHFNKHDHSQQILKEFLAISKSKFSSSTNKKSSNKPRLNKFKNRKLNLKL